MKIDFDVAAVLNCHNEGLLLIPTRESLSRAVAFATNRGLKVEIVIAVDRGDTVTSDVIGEWNATHVQKLHLDNGDLGRSRNDAVKACRSNWIAFIDADDLWGETWLFDAYQAAIRETRTTVWHPEVNLYFGDRPHIIRHVDMDMPDFCIEGLAVTNYWTSLCFCSRSLLLDVPYPYTDLKNGVGFEDWGWNIQILKHGGIHKVVKGTSHAIRTKATSLVRTSTAAGAYPNIAALFRGLLEKSEGKIEITSEKL